MSQDRNSVDDQRKIWFVLGFLGIAALGGLALYWVLKADYVELRTFESTQLTSVVAQELESRGIDYRISNDGLSVSVGKSSTEVANSALASLDIQHADTVGLEIFETSDFGITDFAQKVNYKRAMEGELTRTISSLSEVRHARVHLVLAEKNLLISDEAHPTASIVVFLEENKNLSWAQVAGIQDLVSKSIPSLSKDNVTVTNQNGIVLSSNTDAMTEGSQLNFRTSLESRLKERLGSIIRARFSDIPYSVSINVSLSDESIKRVSESPLPISDSEGAVVSSRNLRETASDGTESVSTERTYTYGVMQETFESKPGRIDRISAAVYIGSDLTDEQKTQLQAFAEAAIGIIPERGDSLVILAEGAPISIPSTLSEPQSDISNSDIPKDAIARESTPSPTMSRHEGTAEELSLEPTVQLGGLTFSLDDSVRYLMISALTLSLALFLVVALYIREMKKDRLSKRELKDLLNLVNRSIEQELSEP